MPAIRQERSNEWRPGGATQAGHRSARWGAPLWRNLAAQWSPGAGLGPVGRVLRVPVGPGPLAPAPVPFSCCCCCCCCSCLGAPQVSPLRSPAPSPARPHPGPPLTRCDLPQAAWPQVHPPGRCPPQSRAALESPVAPEPPVSQAGFAFPVKSTLQRPLL